MLRVLTGDRPTGRLHLGHYAGSLGTRLRIQSEHECFFIIADLHTLTTRHGRAQLAELPALVRELVLDYLACGIDAQRAVIYLQSAVPEVTELAFIFANLVTVPRLQRIPSLKEMAQAANLSELPFGLLGYPVLQAADILLARAHLVPVGKDNESHVELTREVAKRFNRLYGEVFPLPRALLSDCATLVGTDGQAKMSKSLGNAIFLSDDEETVRRKVRAMYTDPARTRADIPGRVEGNPVFAYHDAFNPNTDEVAHFKERYRAGRVGDTEVKDALARTLNTFLEPIRARRAQLEQQPAYLARVLEEGCARMRAEARKTMQRVKEAMGLSARPLVHLP